MFRLFNVNKKLNSECFVRRRTTTSKLRSKAFNIRILVHVSPCSYATGKAWWIFSCFPVALWWIFHLNETVMLFFKLEIFRPKVLMFNFHKLCLDTLACSFRPVTRILFGGVLTWPKWTKLPKCIFHLIIFIWRPVDFSFFFLFLIFIYLFF